MVYYAQGMELEVVSQLFHGSVNDVMVCRDRLSASGMLYTLLAVHDRECARKMLAVMENSQRTEESPCLLRFSQNEMLLFLFPYRDNCSTLQSGALRPTPRFKVIGNSEE